jgi:hypothetical protein
LNPEIPYLSLDSSSQLEVQEYISNAELRDTCKNSATIEVAEKTPLNRAYGANISSYVPRKRNRHPGFASSYFYKWLSTRIESSVNPLDELYPFPTSKDEDSGSPAFVLSVCDD